MNFTADLVHDRTQEGPLDPLPLWMASPSRYFHFIARTEYYYFRLTNKLIATPRPLRPTFHTGESNSNEKGEKSFRKFSPNTTTISLVIKESHTAILSAARRRRFYLR